MTTNRLNVMKRHARGALIGLAVGDALGQPTEGKTPTEIKQQWGRITDFLSSAPAGSDDTEYALFNAQLLLKHGKSLDSEKIAATWREHIASQTGGFKGAGFSEMMAIANLCAGLSPPFCGQHLHSWSDGLAMRVAPFGIVAAGNPQLAAQLAEMDGVVSHAGEGVLSGKAVAAAVAVAMTGAGIDDIIDAALQVIPNDSWTSRAITKGIEIGKNASEVWQALEPLHEAIACAYYHWTDLGPEAAGLAFGIFAAARGNFSDAVLGGVNAGRDTDTIAAIAGAITGAQGGIEVIPPRWAERINHAKGICIHTVAGLNIQQVADDLAALSLKWNDEQ